MSTKSFNFQFVTRSQDNGEKTFATLKDAMVHTDQDLTVWRIRFMLSNGERVSLIRTEEGLWIYDEIY